MKKKKKLKTKTVLCIVIYYNKNINPTLEINITFFQLITSNTIIQHFFFTHLLLYI